MTEKSWVESDSMAFITAVVVDDRMGHILSPSPITGGGEEKNRVNI